MASVSMIQLNNGNVTAASQTASKQLELRHKRFIGWLEISNWVSGTFTVTLQHSPDGVNWVSAGAFSALGANGVEAIQITDSLFGFIRADIAGASLDADLKIQLWYDSDK